MMMMIEYLVQQCLLEVEERVQSCKCLRRLEQLEEGSFDLVVEEQDDRSKRKE